MGDTPIQVAAFTWIEIMSAVCDRYPERFPAVHAGDKRWWYQATDDHLLVKVFQP